MPDNALVGLCRVVGRAIAYGTDIHARLVLLRIVDDLKVMLARFVDGQAGLATILPIGAKLIIPLPIVIRVSVGELQVFNEAFPRVAFPFLAIGKALLGLGNDSRIAG